jgi:hypothetical protein
MVMDCVFFEILTEYLNIVETSSCYRKLSVNTGACVKDVQHLSLFLYKVKENEVNCSENLNFELMKS